MNEFSFKPLNPYTTYICIFLLSQYVLICQKYILDLMHIEFHQSIIDLLNEKQEISKIINNIVLK